MSALPAAVKEALDKKELSINQGYNLTRQLQEVPEEQREQAAIAAVEIEKAKKEIRRKDAEIDQRSRIAGLFCKAFEKGCSAGASKEYWAGWGGGPWRGERDRPPVGGFGVWGEFLAAGRGGVGLIKPEMNGLAKNFRRFKKSIAKLTSVWTPA